MGYQQNALDNDVDIKVNTKVEEIKYSNNEWKIVTSNSQGSFVVPCASVQKITQLYCTLHCALKLTK